MRILEQYLQRFLPKSLFYRFILIIILPVIISQLVVIYAFYERHWFNVNAYMARQNAREVKLLVKAVKLNNLEQASEIANNLNLSYEYRPEEIYKDSKDSTRKELQQLKDELEYELNSKSNIIYSRGENFIKIYLPINNGLLKILIPTKNILSPTTYIFVLWLAFATILTSLIAFLFAKNQVRSILELSTALKNFDIGKNLKFKPTGASEIRLAGEAFLEMKQRLKNYIKRRTELLAMISHDLKMPLTRLQLQLELFNAEHNEAEIKEVEHELKEMSYLIDSYLDYAKDEGGEEFSELDINKYIANILSDQYFANLKIENSALQEEAILKLKPRTFKKAIINIFDNASRYANLLAISYHKESDHLQIFIEDNGQGIAEADREKIFTPFANKNITSKQGKNIGLSLPIVKEIIEDHHGEIELLESDNLGGLMIKITLPLA